MTFGIRRRVPMRFIVFRNESKRLVNCLLSGDNANAKVNVLICIVRYRRWPSTLSLSLSLSFYRWNFDRVARAALGMSDWKIVTNVGDEGYDSCQLHHIRI